MAREVIPEGKRRYQVTLTTERVDSIRSKLRKLGLNQRSIFSAVVDDLLSGVDLMLDQLIQRKIEGKQLSLIDLMQMQLDTAEMLQKEFGDKLKDK